MYKWAEFRKAGIINTLKFSLGRFCIARCTARFILGAFIFLKLGIAKLPNFEFPTRGIILFRRYGLKGIILSLIALLGIPIRLRSL